MLSRLGSTMPSRGLWEGSPFQQASISCQHSSSKQGSRSGLAPGAAGGQRGNKSRAQRANVEAERRLTFPDVVPELVLAGAFLKGLWEFDRTGAEVPEEDAEGVNVHGVVVLPCQGGRSGELCGEWIRKSAEVESSVPVNSSGAMWMGVPTMLPDIMASGLQKPRSVIFARFCLSNCPQETLVNASGEITWRKSLRAAGPSGFQHHRLLWEERLTRTFFSLMSRWRRP